MASVYGLKPRFQQLLRPLLAPLARFGITPNMLTLGSLLGSAGVGLVTWLQGSHPLWLLMPIWLAVRMALNALDGMLAREHELQSRLGEVLNELGDVLSDVLLYGPLAAVQPSAGAAISCFVLLGCLTEFCGLLGRAMGGTRRYDGPMGKSDRAAFVAVVMLLTGLVRLLRYLWSPLFWGAALLAGYTCYNRLQRALREPRA